MVSEQHGVDGKKRSFWGKMSLLPLRFGDVYQRPSAGRERTVPAIRQVEGVGHLGDRGVARVPLDLAGARVGGVDRAVVAVLGQVADDAVAQRQLPKSNNWSST